MGCQLTAIQRINQVYRHRLLHDPQCSHWCAFWQHLYAGKIESESLIYCKCQGVNVWHGELSVCQSKLLLHGAPENHDSFFFWEVRFSDFPSTQLLGGGLGRSSECSCAYSCSLYLCFHHTPSNRPLLMTGSSIPRSRARVPTKTSPPCGLAGFKKGFAGVGRCRVK